MVTNKTVSRHLTFSITGEVVSMCTYIQALKDDLGADHIFTLVRCKCKLLKAKSLETMQGC